MIRFLRISCFFGSRALVLSTLKINKRLIYLIPTYDFPYGVKELACASIRAEILMTACVKGIFSRFKILKWIISYNRIDDPLLIAMIYMSRECVFDHPKHEKDHINIRKVLHWWVAKFKKRVTIWFSPGDQHDYAWWPSDYNLATKVRFLFYQNISIWDLLSKILTWLS